MDPGTLGWGGFPPRVSPWAIVQRPYRPPWVPSVRGRRGARAYAPACTRPHSGEFIDHGLMVMGWGMVGAHAHTPHRYPASERSFAPVGAFRKGVCAYSPTDIRPHPGGGLLIMDPGKLGWGGSSPRVSPRPGFRPGQDAPGYESNERQCRIHDPRVPGIVLPPILVPG